MPACDQGTGVRSSAADSRTPHAWTGTSSYVLLDSTHDKVQREEHLIGAVRAPQLLDRLRTAGAFSTNMISRTCVFAMFKMLPCKVSCRFTAQLEGKEDKRKDKHNLRQRLQG